MSRIPPKCHASSTWLLLRKPCCYLWNSIFFSWWIYTLQNIKWVLCDRHNRIMACNCHVDQVLPRYATCQARYGYFGSKLTAQEDFSMVSRPSTFTWCFGSNQWPFTIINYIQLPWNGLTPICGSVSTVCHAPAVNTLLLYVVMFIVLTLFGARCFFVSYKGGNISGTP